MRHLQGRVRVVALVDRPPPEGMHHLVRLLQELLVVGLDAEPLRVLVDDLIAAGKTEGR